MSDPMNKNCLFCQVEQGKQSAEVIYADQHCMAIMDVFPLKPAHVLLISRFHAQRFEQLPVEIAQHMTGITQRVAKALTVSGFAEQGYNLVINNGKVANQHIPHVHLHLIPRHRGDKLRLFWRYMTRFVVDGIFKNRRQQQLIEAAESIRQALRSSD